VVMAPPGGRNWEARESGEEAREHGGDLAAFSAGFGVALSSGAGGDPVGAFSDEEDRGAGGLEELVSKRAEADVRSPASRQAFPVFQLCALAPHPSFSKMNGV